MLKAMFNFGVETSGINQVYKRRANKADKTNPKLAALLGRVSAAFFKSGSKTWSIT